MIKYFHYLLLIFVLFSISACSETIEANKNTASKSKTSIRVNWQDSISDSEPWTKSMDVTGYTGSTMLGDLAEVADLDSASIKKFETENNFLENFEGSIPNSNTEKYHYPLRSNSGGSVDGFYDSSELIRIESIFDAKFGYSTINVDFKDGEIEEINYHQHFADYDKFKQNFPDFKVVDSEKLTFTDTSYVLQFGTEKSSKKYSGKTFISSDVKESLIEHLIDCANKMKRELSYEREFGE